MYRALPHILARIFGPPLLIAPTPLDALITGLHAAMRHRGSLLPEPEAADPAAMPPTPVDQKPRGYRIDRGVAIVPVHDVLVRRAGQVAPDSTPLQSYENLGRIIATAQRDPRVRGTLLNIDSPGGEAGGVFDLATDIRRLSKQKPIWSIANDDALSAAYVLASAGDRVWATQTSSIGSLGVVALHADQSGFDDERGIKYTYVFKGARKIDGNPHGPLSSEAQVAIQSEVDRLYDKLVAMVGEHRGIDPARIRGQDASVYFGERAQAPGLVDHIGTLDEAHAALVEHIQPRGVRMETTTAPPPEAQSDNVIQLRIDEARAAARAEHGEIAQLCNLAGHPDLAAGFIAEGLGIKAVITKLQAAQAAAVASRPIVSADTTTPSADADVIAKLRVAAAKRFEEMGRAHPLPR